MGYMRQKHNGLVTAENRINWMNTNSVHVSLEPPFAKKVAR
jgi:hypothetical protein